ncbi:hypothetical protein BJX63DRAFT_427189 [Aspergillus granulosus]|uniref:Uncharacterized protein n=1 Tax=Aspergillus granulosus TaxID=176169 RepID=A0ABR4I6X6_9EURO
MASLILIGAVLIVAKAADEHDKKKREESLPTAGKVITFTPHENNTVSRTESSSKRDILSRRYWYERRRSRKEAGSPLPYEAQPMYRDLDLEKVDEPYELDGTPVELGYFVHELPGTEPSIQVEHHIRQHTS